MDARSRLVHQTVHASRPTLVRLEQPVLIVARDGLMRLEAAQKRWLLVPGHGALLAAGAEARVSVPARFSGTWVHFAPLPDAPVQPLAVMEVTPLLQEMLAGLSSLGLAAGALARLMVSLADVALALARMPRPLVMPLAETPTLAHALALAEAELESLPAFGDVARESGQSTRSLTRRCADELGMSWREVVRRLRMLRAVEALAMTDAAVAEIAISVGYSALSGFNEAFRDLMGRSPTEFRSFCRAAQDGG